MCGYNICKYYFFDFSVLSVSYLIFNVFQRNSMHCLVVIHCKLGPKVRGRTHLLHVVLAIMVICPVLKSHNVFCISLIQGVIPVHREGGASFYALLAYHYNCIWPILQFKATEDIPRLNLASLYWHIATSKVSHLLIFSLMLYWRYKWAEGHFSLVAHAWEQYSCQDSERIFNYYKWWCSLAHSGPLAHNYMKYWHDAWP